MLQRPRPGEGPPGARPARRRAASEGQDARASARADLLDALDRGPGRGRRPGPDLSYAEPALAALKVLLAVALGGAGLPALEKEIQTFKENIKKLQGASDMAARSSTLEGNRKLIVSSLGASADYELQRPFVTLLPAFNAPERQQAEALTKELIDLGCVEFCCVGPEAELLHDALDEIIEAKGALEVVTTWVEDPTDATEYFLHAAAGGRANLLALILSHPELRAMLEEEA